MSLTGIATLLRKLPCTTPLNVSGGITLGGPLMMGDASHFTGKSVVVLTASGGMTGRFSGVSGTGTGSKHWRLKYSSTQVTAVLVA